MGLATLKSEQSLKRKQLSEFSKLSDPFKSFRLWRGAFTSITGGHGSYSSVQYTFTSQHFLSREIVSIHMKTYSGCPRGIKEVRTSGAFGPQPHNYRASQDSPKLSRVISCPLNLKTRFTCHVPRWLEEEVIDGDSVTAPRFISNEKETNFKQNTFKHYTFF